MTNNDTPYPRLGEIVHFIIHAFGLFGRGDAFGLFGRGDALSKRLNRFAKEKDFNIVTANECINEALLQPLRKIDINFANDVEKWLTKLLDDYKTIILQVQTDILSRSYVMNVLLTTLFVPSTLVFLKNLPNSPNIKKWFHSSDTVAIKEVLLYWMKINEVSEDKLINALCNYSEKDEDSVRKLLQRWKNDKTLPKISSLLDIKNIHLEGKKTNNLVIWLLLARAWQYTLQEVTKKKEFNNFDKLQFHEFVNKFYQKKLDGFIVDPMLVKFAFNLYMDNLAKVSNDREYLWNHLTPVLKIELQNKKDIGDEIKAQVALKKFEQNKLYPYYKYVSEYRWGHYYALCADYKKALEHYKKAFEHGAYRAGPHLLGILRNVILLSVYLDKTNIIKKYYGWACVLGLFSGENKEPELWELEQMKMACFQHFHSDGLYQCVDKQKKVEMEEARAKSISSTSIITTDWEKRPVDLRNPNRMINNYGPRKLTQLMIFIELKQNDKVKLLLEHGADPNTQISDGSTALMRALQIKNTEAAELILQHPNLKKETLNARTKRYKYTTLQIAIENGYVDIIRSLIDKGVDIEQACDVADLSPLYYAIDYYHKLHQAKKEGTLSLPKNNPPPSFYRRTAHELHIHQSGALFDKDFEKNFNAIHKMNQTDPELKYIQEFLIDYYSIDLSTTLKIIDLLIEAGADVNKPKKTLHNFTPFLYSAEIGYFEIFQRLYEAGGDITFYADDKETNIFSL